MHDALPAATVFAVVANPTSPTAPLQLRNIRTAAEKLGTQLHVLYASTEQELDTAFTALSQLRVGGLVFTSDPYFANRSQRLAALAVGHAVPAITQSRDFPVAGGLMSYGGDFTQSHRQAGIYAGRVLNGENPSQLPVQRVTKVEFFLNLKAAATLGIVLPASLISSADEVIE
jgi:putative ABC transport system substrate-binding protein